MNRYGADYDRSMNRYGGDFRRWGNARGYDRDLGDRAREGWSSIRRETRDFFDQGYDRDFFRGRQDRFAQPPMQRYDYGYTSGRGFQGRQFRNQSDFDRDAEMRTMGGRPYPDPWSGFPGSVGYGLGFGQGRGQFIYK